MSHIATTKSVGALLFALAISVPSSSAAPRKQADLAAPNVELIRGSPLNGTYDSLRDCALAGNTDCYYSATRIGNQPKRVEPPKSGESARIKRAELAPKPIVIPRGPREGRSENSAPSTELTMWNNSGNGHFYTSEADCKMAAVGTCAYIEV